VDRRDKHARRVDHVHVLIQINPSDSVAGVVQILKGGTSRVIRKEFPGLEEFLWGDSFWADGYFAESVGKIDVEVIRKYIKNQQRWPWQIMPAGWKPRVSARGSSL